MNLRQCTGPAMLLAAMACVGPARLARGETRLTVALVPADASEHPLAAAARGSIVPYSHYRGPVTSWATDLSVDGKHAFDQRDAQGRIATRRTQLELELAEGEHTLEPIGAKFRVAAGAIESLSPELKVDGKQVSLRLFPVEFVSLPADQPQMPIRLRIAAGESEVFRSAPATYSTGLVVYLPASPPGGYATNLSDLRLAVSDRGASWLPAPGNAAPNNADAPRPLDTSAGASARVTAQDFTVGVPTVPVTAVLLLDRPADRLAVQLSAREEATQNVDFEPKLGNWDPRPRFTAHGRLSRSQAGWTLLTGLHEWQLTADEQDRFGHHAVLVDRPVFHEPDGQDKERVLLIALATDHVTAGVRLSARWRWIGQKGLPPAAENRLVAFCQQAPTVADDAAGWQPLVVEAQADGLAEVLLPKTLTAGRAWLRIGLAGESEARPSDRLLADVPLVVADAPPTGPKPAPPAPARLTPLAIGTPAAGSRVPDAYRQGVFLDPQNISAIDISPDGKSIAVATMAFRHDRNFWLLSDAGQIQWGRHIDPWAPQSTAVLAGGQTCALGLAYSRFTDPAPTVSVFAGERGDETALVDAFWDLGWLRYGEGDWRSGWPASLLGDLMVRSGNQLFTVSSHDGARRFDATGRGQSWPLAYQRPLRMAASADGRVLALGYLAPDASALDEKSRSRLRLPPALLATRDALTSAELWRRSADELAAAPAVDQPPEAADNFPELAAVFRTRPQTLLPFRAPLALGVSGDGSRVAMAEYRGWLRLKQERGIGSWNPDHPVSYCPRQRGRLQVFGAGGETLAAAEFPTAGLFDVQLDAAGKTVWCWPQSWFARGLAGRSWLPADPGARTVYAFDVDSRSWHAAWQFPDAVRALAVAPGGSQVLASCWNGRVYLLAADGQVRADIDVGDAARLAWSPDGTFAIAGTQQGEVWCLESGGQVRWHTALPAARVREATEPAKPVFADVPIYSVGRVGGEHAYVGDMWLIKAPEGALMVDGGGSSAIPLSWQRMRAAGVAREELRYVLVSHSHGDHAGALYLWRTGGAKIVAPQSAALTLGWLMPTWTDYGIWVPTPVDEPLPLGKVGDEAEITLCGQRVQAIFVPGHSFDSVVYLMDFGGKRVAFTGDIGFEGESHILHRTWGDVLAAQAVTRVIREKVLPRKPDYVFTGHTALAKGTEFLESLVERTEAAIKKGQ